MSESTSLGGDSSGKGREWFRSLPTGKLHSVHSQAYFNFHVSFHALKHYEVRIRREGVNRGLFGFLFLCFSSFHCDQISN